MDRLRTWPQRFQHVGDVRGLGLMIGVEIVRDRSTKEPAQDIRDRIVNIAFERGLLTLGAGQNAIRLSPPLVISRDQADFAADTLEECLQAIEHS
jgi:4-aminobutyrate aminotransferase